MPSEPLDTVQDRFHPLMSKSSHTLEDVLARRPVDRDAVEAHKQRMLAAIAAHPDSEHDGSPPGPVDAEQEAEKTGSGPRQQ